MLALKLAVTLPLHPALPLRPALTVARRSLVRMNDQGVDYPIKKTANEWMKQLDPEQYQILRNKGTERPGVRAGRSRPTTPVGRDSAALPTRLVTSSVELTRLRATVADGRVQQVLPQRWLLRVRSLRTAALLGEGKVRQRLRLARV